VWEIRCQFLEKQVSSLWPALFVTGPRRSRRKTPDSVEKLVNETSSAPFTAFEMAAFVYLYPAGFALSHITAQVAA
jgi:hypothetical protein